MQRKIEISPGSNIESAVYALLDAKARGESAYAEFNGHKLYSDTVSMDSAYIEITGRTKADLEKAREEWFKKHKIEQEEAKRKAQEKIPAWIQRGKELIFPERYEEWERCVSERANDLYNGMELDASLDIMQALKNGITMEEAKEMLDGQGHSGASEALVRNIVLIFSNKGPEFWEATAYGEISPENKKLLEEKKDENLQLTQINSQTNSSPKL